MTVRVVSLVWGTAWERYGRAFAQSFQKFWPGHVELIMVTDQNLPLMRGRQIDLSGIHGYGPFKAAYGGDPKANGYESVGFKVNDKGYCWRMDAVKWMPQALAPVAALEGLEDGDILVWFDADVETTSKVPEDWVETLLGDADVACLQRPGIHSEIGFYAVRINHLTCAMLNKFAGFYRTGDVFKLREWHSAYVFDRALETEPDLVVKNLNTGKGSHVFETSPLAKHTVHRKGKRKDNR